MTVEEPNIEGPNIEVPNTEGFFEELYHFAACGQLSTDVDGVIDVVNGTFLEWSGLAREEVVGIIFRDLLTRGSQLFYETRYQPVLKLGGEVREVALELTRADGSRMPILVNAKVVGGSTRIAVFDSTERQGYERELLAARRVAEVSESRVRVLQDASTAFLAAETDESLADALLEIARDALIASDGAVVLHEETSTPRLLAGAKFTAPLWGLRGTRPDQAGPLYEEMMVVENMRDAEAMSSEVADILRSIRMEAFTATPLMGTRGALGSLVLMFGRERSFDAASLDLHRALARQASLALGRLRLQAELERMALHDQLTGLANRNLLRERLTLALDRADSEGRAMSIIFLDLDGFKAINDGLGHRVGDVVLQIVAKRLAGVLREGDTVGRFGGDEFLIVCEQADAEAAMLVAKRVIATIAEPIAEMQGDQELSASVGIACFVPGNPPPTLDALVRAADAAMYSSKSAGLGRITTVAL